MISLYIAFRQTAEDEDLVSRLKAKNENLESELSSLRRKIEEQDKLNRSCIEVEMSALRMEKTRLEELVAGMKNEQQQKAAENSVEVVNGVKAQKIELEERLASVSAELERYQHAASNDADAELITLRDEKHRMDMLVAYLENEVQRHKDIAHEQRIRALDLKHELREVRFMLFYSLCNNCLFSHVTSFCFVPLSIHSCKNCIFTYSQKGIQSNVK